MVRTLHSDIAAFAVLFPRSAEQNNRECENSSCQRAYTVCKAWNASVSFPRFCSHEPCLSRFSRGKMISIWGESVFSITTPSPSLHSWFTLSVREIIGHSVFKKFLYRQIEPAEIIIPKSSSRIKETHQTPSKENTPPLSCSIHK